MAGGMAKQKKTHRHPSGPPAASAMAPAAKGPMSVPRGWATK